MKEQRFAYLFERFYSKADSPVERDEFLQLINSGKYDEQLESLVDRKYEKFEFQVGPFSLEKENEIFCAILKKSSLDKTNLAIPGKTQRLWHRIVAAASILLFIAVGLYFYSKNTTRNNAERFASLIAPGKSSATLTLANGKKIRLSEVGNGTLTVDGSIGITKTSNGELVYDRTGQGNSGLKSINVLSTAKGETYQVRLPDGSLVTLNSASDLTYSTGLNNDGERRVELSGEAYFEVAKDKRHPFIVKTSTQEIRVLGTHFNVSSYADEDAVKTTLLEGAVSVKTANEQKVIKPGEQAVSQRNTVRVVKADLESAVAWKNGEFVFTGQPITEIMRILSRWYNVDVEYRGPITREQFEGSSKRERNIKEVLELLELTGAVHFKIEGRKIIVTK